MPRIVKNYWINGSVDGRSTRISMGPADRTGGFDLLISMRADGGVTEPCRIKGYADEDGTLKLRVMVKGQEDIVIRTMR